MPTIFKDIEFNQQYHTYTYRGKRLTSVTKKANSLKPPFDREGLSKKAAQERGVSVETVLAEWDANRDAAFARGNKVHSWIADHLEGNTVPFADPFLSLNEKLPEMTAFEKLWEYLKSLVSVQKVEYVIGDSELGIAGTLDALLLNKHSDDYHIWDWKTGKAFSTENRFAKLLYPFDDLDDSDLSNYSIQISLYRLILKRNIDADYQLGDCYIAHLDPQGNYYLHRAIDLTERVELWLKGV